MSWFAVRVDYEMEYDEGFPPYAAATETGAFEAGDAEAACEMAKEALAPYGTQWGPVAWEAVECRDGEEARMRATDMERWYWRG